MTREEVYDMYYHQEFQIRKYEPLIAIGCAIQYEDGDWGEEFIFTVSIKWLVDYMNKNYDHKNWEWEDVQLWLQSEYVYEDSLQIFEQAIKENVCVNMNF